MSMAPAGLRHRRVTIQSRAATKGTYGEPTGTWSDVATVWAHVRPLSGRELQAAQQLSTEVTHRITIPYKATLADPVVMAQRRVSFGSRVFNIHAVMNPDERNVELVLHCSEGLNDG